MQLKKIEILNYKSINSVVTINFNYGEPVTLIGKNGSGKTNILEALKQTLGSGHNTTFRHDSSMQGTYYFRLSKEELDEYFNHIELNGENELIKVEYFGKTPTVRMITSPAVQISVKEFSDEIEEILSAFKSAARTYINSLKKIENDEYAYFNLYPQIECESLKGSLTHLTKRIIEDVQNQIGRQINDIKEVLDYFKGDSFTLDNFRYSKFDHNYNYPIPLYTINEQELLISPIIAKSLGLTKDKLEEANKRFNKEIRHINECLKDSYARLKLQIERFEQLKNKISSVFSKANDDRYTERDERNKIKQKFLQDLKNATFAHCYYLDNETTMLFSPLQENEYARQQASQINFNYRNPILEALHVFLSDKGVYRENESFLEYDKLGQDRRAEFIDLINNDFLPKNLPSFEKGEIKGFILKDENNTPALYVIEDNGTEINVNNTSLGRRWYLTYLLIKSILKLGDLLLIDEPAAFLHPQAQLEIKQELKELASSGIFVIYATHSPYMIPENWGNVYNVKSTGTGTQVTQLNSDDELSATIKEELGITRSADILFNLDKTLLLVEGVADKACIEKFADLLGYDISQYKIHICDGDAILQVAYIYLKLGIEKVYIVLDNDNNYKPDHFKRSHSMYQECMDEIRKHPDKCVFIGEGKKGCLEDYLKDSDHKFKYFDNKKQLWKTSVKGINAIAQKEEVCDTTLHNFEQLFIQLGIPKLDKENQ